MRGDRNKTCPTRVANRFEPVVAFGPGCGSRIQNRRDDHSRSYLQKLFRKPYTKNKTSHSQCLGSRRLNKAAVFVRLRKTKICDRLVFSRTICEPAAKAGRWRKHE